MLGPSVFARDVYSEFYIVVHHSVPRLVVSQYGATRELLKVYYTVKKVCGSWNQKLYIGEYSGSLFYGVAQIYYKKKIYSQTELRRDAKIEK
jgi:hypothetical protein